jgi:hypothetical protein
VVSHLIVSCPMSCSPNHHIPSHQSLLCVEMYLTGFKLTKQLTNEDWMCKCSIWILTSLSMPKTLRIGDTVSRKISQSSLSSGYKNSANRWSGSFRLSDDIFCLFTE